MEWNKGLLFAVLALSVGNVAAQEQAMLGDASTQDAGASRLRLFGQNGIGMVLYTDAVCTRTYGEKIRASGSMGSAFSSMLGKVKNESLGIPATATTRGLSERGMLLSKAYYREYSLAGGKPVVLEAGMQSPTGWRCERTITSVFTPEPGRDYEAAMDVDFSDGVCTLKVNRVEPDGELVRVAVRPASKDCSAPVAGTSDG